MDTLNIFSYNWHGLNSRENQRDVFEYLKSKLCHIYCLQDTYFTAKDESFIRNQWGGECIFNCFAANQREIAILLANNLEYKIKKDENGNFLGVDITIEGKNITLVNLYGPNNDSPSFYNKVNEIMESFNYRQVILTGEFNLVQNQTLDTCNYLNLNSPRARETVFELIETYDLIDSLREFYPDKKRYTWRKNNPL